jgi:hypothetical protein
MIEERERPDLSFSDPVNRDRIDFYKRKKKLLIRVSIDQTGNEWDIPISIIKDLIELP